MKHNENKYQITIDVCNNEFTNKKHKTILYIFHIYKELLTNYSTITSVSRYCNHISRNIIYHTCKCAKISTITVLYSYLTIRTKIIMHQTESFLDPIRRH